MTNEEIPDSQIRNAKLATISQESALFALNKAKSLVMACWCGGSIATTMSVASFFDVSEDAIRQISRTYRLELASDGVRTFAGSQLQDVRDLLSLASKVSNATIWTPRAILRVGMVLRDSAVAAQVRNVLLDQVEKNPNPGQLGLEADPWSLTDEQAGRAMSMAFGGGDESEPTTSDLSDKAFYGINYVLSHDNLTAAQRIILEDLLS